MKTIRIIDLLVKIANGEEVPKKIKWHDSVWIRDYENAFYYYEEGTDNLFMDDIGSTVCLNKEVEIIEDTPKEDKKIAKLKIYDDMINWCCNGKAINDIEKDIIDKMNEIIDKINGDSDE